MNNNEPNNSVTEFDSQKNATKVIEYLRLEMQEMKQNQLDYQKEYEPENRGTLIPFGGIMEFYMSEKRRIANLEDETQKQQEQQRLDDALINNVKRFKPTPGIILEDNDVETLMELVHEGLIRMDLDTEASAEPEARKSCLRTAPKFMLSILESLKGKVNKSEMPEKVDKIEKYISYLRFIDRAEIKLTNNPLQYYIGRERDEEGLTNNLCYIRGRIKFCYSMNRYGNVSENSRWLQTRKLSIESGLERMQTMGQTRGCDILTRIALAKQEKPENIRLAMLLNEMVILNGYKDIEDYRRTLGEKGENMPIGDLCCMKNQRILEIQSQIRELLEGKEK